MSCLGVTGKPMVVTYMGQSGNPTDELSCNMDITWTTYYGKDFTWIVLELVGALEQRIRVVTNTKILQWIRVAGHSSHRLPSGAISKVNASRFTLVMTRKGKQVW